MTATDAFFNWFFTGLNGLGGWFLFFLIALGAVIWLLYDSSKRRLPAIGWRLAAILTAAMLLPTIIYRFSSTDTQTSLNQFVEAIFYLGLLGGIIPLVVAIGYFVTYRGMVGCPDGHVYEKELGQCPDPSHKPPVQVIQTPQPMPVRQQEPPPAAPPPPPKPKAQAWLVAGDGHSYQLNLELTTVGRSSTNDIQITNDATVSREHAKIVEQNGHFRLYDLGSTSGTRVNSHAVRQAVLLEPDDMVELGDNTRLQFVTMRR
jgi:hypothetical protein